MKKAKAATVVVVATMLASLVLVGAVSAGNGSKGKATGTAQQGKPVPKAESPKAEGMPACCERMMQAMQEGNFPPCPMMKQGMKMGQQRMPMRPMMRPMCPMMWMMGGGEEAPSVPPEAEKPAPEGDKPK